MNGGNVIMMVCVAEEFALRPVMDAGYQEEDLRWFVDDNIKRNGVDFFVLRCRTARDRQSMVDILDRLIERRVPLFTGIIADGDSDIAHRMDCARESGENASFLVTAAYSDDASGKSSERFSMIDNGNASVTVRGMFDGFNIDFTPGNPVLVGCRYIYGYIPFING